MYVVAGFFFLFKNYQRDREIDFGDGVMMLFGMTLGDKVNEVY